MLLLCVSSSAYTRVSGQVLSADDNQTGTIIDVRSLLSPVTLHETVEDVASTSSDSVSAEDSFTSGVSSWSGVGWFCLQILQVALFLQSL